MKKNVFKIIKNSKTGSEGSSLAIALFFFMLCSLICAGVLYVANSSILGVSQHFDADDVPEFVEPAPIPTPEPTPEIDPAYQGESEAINYVYNTLAYEFDALFAAVSSGEAYNILHNANPRSLPYELMSYINAYFGTVYRQSSNKYFNLSELNESDQYYVEVDANGDMIPKEFIVTVSGYDVKVVIDLDGTNKSEYNKILIFNAINFTVSSGSDSGCTYVREYSNSYPGEGYCYLKWVAAGSGLPKRFTVKNFKW